MSPPTNPVQVHNFHAPANRLRPGEKRADCEEPFFCTISTEGALRLPATYDNHPIRPSIRPTNKASLII